MSLATDIAETGLLPEALLRHGIRERLHATLQREAQMSDARRDFRLGLRTSPIALHQEAANQQHYEVPAEFFRLVLGRHLKYSSGWWWPDTQDLDTAEADMLAITCRRAQLQDGQDILELGCGWGSLTLWMAEQYPHARIHAVSNSHGQRRFIEACCRERGYDHVTVETCDLSDFSSRRRYDRVVSVECFEHMRGYRELFRRIAGWLRDDGCAFVHVFCHDHFVYPFEHEQPREWMARHFFTGGIMPSFDLFADFDEHLQLQRSWRVDGRHYARTARAWLRNLEGQRPAVLRLLRGDLSLAAAWQQYNRWRLFFLACDELFGYRQGREWFVGHYRLVVRSGARTAVTGHDSAGRRVG